MITEVKTIPELLVTTRGNQSEVARILDVNRSTIMKYARDHAATSHAIINDRLMVKTSKKGSERHG
jgi:DNA-binding NtrC family response regulator